MHISVTANCCLVKILTLDQVGPVLESMRKEQLGEHV